MVCFITKSGTIYYINPTEGTIYGDEFDKPKPYVDIKIKVGKRALIKLADGSIFRTPEVVIYA